MAEGDGVLCPIISTTEAPKVGCKGRKCKFWDSTRNTCWEVSKGLIWQELSAAIRRRLSEDRAGGKDGS